MGKFSDQTGQDIETAFQSFHAKNPKVYLLFKEQCFRSIRLNKSKISSKQIIGYIRWEIALQTDRDDDFKINDAFTSHYARLFAKEHPQYEDIFNYRKLRSGTDTIARRLLTEFQLSILRTLEIAHIVKVGSTLHLQEPGKDSRPLDFLTFNRLLSIKFIKEARQLSEGVYEYVMSDKAKEYLQSTTN